MNKKQCNRFKELIVDALYNELQDKDRAFFNSHNESCPACALEYKEMSGTLNVMAERRQPEVREEFWDDFLPNIKGIINEEDYSHAHSPNGFRRLKQWWQRHAGGFNVRWVLYPVSASLLVVMGIAIGLFLDSPEGRRLTGNPELAVSSAKSVNPGVSEHFDNLRPVLIDYSNYSAPAANAAGVVPASHGGSDSTDLVTVDRDTMQRLILQNHLLKQAVARSGNKSLSQLLEDIEMILLEVSNAESEAEKQQAIQSAQELINDNDVLFKMKVFDKKSSWPSAPKI